MNVPGGFANGFSLFYASLAPASVTVYDGPDGSGNVLATINLAPQFNANGCVGDPTGAICNWTPVGVSFSGIARSGKSMEEKLCPVHSSTLTIIDALTCVSCFAVDFGGAANLVGFDDITIGSATPGNAGG
jgi:hypothetical protein